MSRTGWYKDNHRLETRNKLLREQILNGLSVNPSYGRKRIALALNLGRRRVKRVMKFYEIKPYRINARWTKRRDLGRLDAKYQNLIKGTCPVGPEIIPASDFTRILYMGEVVYLAAFMDLYTRETAGWNMSIRYTQELVINAFFDAIKTLGKIPKIVHSDQGSKYQSHEYTALMKKLEIQISMSEKGSPWENGCQESWYDNFKTDLGLEFDRFNTLGELIEAIHHTISYYNQTRIHTALKMSPVQFRHLYHQRLI